MFTKLRLILFSFLVLTFGLGLVFLSLNFPIFQQKLNLQINPNPVGTSSEPIQDQKQKAKKEKFDNFLGEIEDILMSFNEIFWQIDRTNVTIAGVKKPFEIGNLIHVVDEVLDWEENKDAKTELYALHEHNSSGLIVKEELETAFKKIKNDFWVEIHSVLGRFFKLKIEYIDTDSEYSVIDLLKPENFNIENIEDFSQEAEDEFMILLEDNFNKEKLKIAHKNTLVFLDSFLSIIKPTLQNFEKSQITEVTIDGEPYLIGELTKTLTTTGSTQINKSQIQLINLYNYNHVALVVKKKLDVFLETLKIDNYQIDIQTILKFFSVSKVAKVTINGEVYWINHLFNHLDTPGSAQTGAAKIELMKLRKNAITKTELDTALTVTKERREDFLAKIQHALKVLAELSVNKLESKLEKTTYKIKNLVLKENINKAYADMSFDAQKELNKLFFAGIDDNFKINKIFSETTAGKEDLRLEFFYKIFQESLKKFASNDLIPTKKVFINDKSYKIGYLVFVDNTRLNFVDLNDESKEQLKILAQDFIDSKQLHAVLSRMNPLDNLLVEIRNSLQNLADIKITKVTIDGKLYLIGELTQTLTTIGSKQTGKAKVQLLALYKHEPIVSVVNVKLVTALKTVRDDFTTSIHDVLVDLKAIKVEKLVISEGANEKSYSIMELTKPENIDKKYAELFSQDAKNEFTDLMADKVDTTKITKFYKGLLDSFLADIKTTLQEFVTVKITEVTIGGKSYLIGSLTQHLSTIGSSQVGDAKTQLLALYNYDSGGSAVNIKLETALKTVRDDFESDIHDVLVDLKAIKVKKFVINKGVNEKNYSIMELTKPENIGKKYADLSDEAKDEFTKLLANNINEEKLTTFYKELLDTFLNIIRSTLQEFATGDITSVTIGGKSYLIGSLTQHLSTIGSSQVGDAKTQLLALYNYDSGGSAVNIKLETALKTVRDDFESDIYDVLVDLKAIKINKIKIGNETYSWTELTKPENMDKNYADLSDEARGEFTKLLANDINEEKLTTFYKELLDTFLDIIKPTLQEFATHSITSVTIGGKSYLIGSLTQHLSTIGSSQVGDAKTQLINLYNYNPDSEIVKQKLEDNINDIKLIIFLEKRKISAFQKNWDAGKASTYLLWLPVFDIKWVKLSQNKVVSVELLAATIQTMLTKEKFDFTKLQGKARKQLFDLLNNEGKLREVETFQDDVWKQIKNHQKWKAIEGPAGELSLQLIKTLLLKIQDLEISKVSHPFFPENYDLSFLKDNPNWEKISFQELLQGMKVVVNESNVEFYSYLFPEQVVFQVPMKDLSTVFSEITIINIIKSLEKAISDHPQQEKKTDSNSSKNDVEMVEKTQIQKKSKISNNNLTIGLSVAGGILTLSALGGGFYWFFKVKK